MNRPTPNTLSRWYEQQPEGEYTCSRCGTVGPKWSVQPQHPYYAQGKEGTALCGPCIGKVHQEYRERRKAQLAALPRCEVSTCSRRATYTVAGSVGLCGHHLRRAQTNHQRRCAGFGGMALFLPVEVNRELVLKLAQEA